MIETQMEVKMKISDIDKQIAQLQAKKLELQSIDVNERKRHYSKSINPFHKELAEKFHGIFCHWNHTDGCSWYYENNSTDPELTDWKGNAHAGALKQAQAFLQKCPEHITQTEIRAILNAFEAAKKA